MFLGTTSARGLVATSIQPQWSGTAIGGVLSGAGIVGATFSLGVGLTSDRHGRKPFLLAYEALCTVCALVALLTTQPILLTAAIVLAGFGRGAKGSAGPFAPAEQAWLAETVKPESRGFVFSLNAALGLTGMAVGAMAAMLPTLWEVALGTAGSYRPLFLIVIVGNVANILLLWSAHERVRPPKPATPSPPRLQSRAGGVRQRENDFLRRLMALNAIKGLSAGLTSPLMAYWFALRFHAGPASIGPVMALAFIVTAAAALLSGGLTRRLGLVNVVVWGRSGDLVLLLLLPLMPAYALAALTYVLRSAVSRSTTGARQALVVSAVRNERRRRLAGVLFVSLRSSISCGGGRHHEPRTSVW